MHVTILNHHTSNNSASDSQNAGLTSHMRKREQKGKEKVALNGGNKQRKINGADSFGKDGSHSRDTTTKVRSVRKKEDANNTATFEDNASSQFQVPNSCRYRKNQAEMDVLYKEFKKNKGKMPPRKHRL